ncbi:MAG: MaoC/PaaZ C-terminal domain-containing protein [Acidimicrobiia bacterium]
MPVSDKNVGVSLEPSRGSWSTTDSILYALGVGAGIQDPVGFELEFTTENSQDVAQRALPTMPVVIDTGGIADATGLIGDFDWTGLLHGGQAVTLHRELPPEGEVEAVTTLAEVWDKGKAAIVVLESDARLVGDDNPLYTTRTTLVMRGEGDFGGERGPSGESNPTPDRDPDHEVAYDIRPDQPLLYRLSGDRNPLHSDPSFAELAGFDRPILHGLCTFGHAGRALLHTLCDSDPARFGHIEGKFTSPVMPGETLTTRMWVDGDSAAFDVTGSDGRVVFGDGLFRKAS